MIFDGLRGRQDSNKAHPEAANHQLIVRHLELVALLNELTLLNTACRAVIIARVKRRSDQPSWRGALECSWRGLPLRAGQQKCRQM